MKRLHLTLSLLLALSILSLNAQSKKELQVKSPDGKLAVKIETGDKIRWSVQYGSTPVLSPSSVSLELNDGTVLGQNATDLRVGHPQRMGLDDQQVVVRLDLVVERAVLLAEQLVEHQRPQVHQQRRDEAVVDAAG